MKKNLYPSIEGKNKLKQTATTMTNGETVNSSNDKPRYIYINLEPLGLEMEDYNALNGVEEDVKVDYYSYKPRWQRGGFEGDYDRGVWVPIKVSEEEYKEYMRPVWVYQKRIQVKDNREKTLSLESLREECGFDTPSSEPTIENLVEVKLEHEIVRKEVNKLPPKEYEIIELRYITGKSERETAAILGTPRKTIAYRHGKILDKLHNIIE